MKAQLAFLYLCVASISLGIKLQQSILILFVLFQLGMALAYGTNLGAIFAKGRRAAAFFYGFMIVSAVITQIKLPSAHPTRFHWAFGAFWAISPMMIPHIRWENLHRWLLVCSVPGLAYSTYWLLQPDEISWAMKIGFTMFPRAGGLVSNPITNAEGLVVLGCWSLARLNNHMGSKERRWVLAHLGWAILIVVFSRVRSGLVGFTVLFFLTALFSSKQRKLSLTAWLAMAGIFVGTISIFGFNMASIYERMDLAKTSWHLFSENPIFGIGPNKWKELEPVDGKPMAHPHNSLLGLATETGVLGLLAYLFFMGNLGLHLLRIRKKFNDPDDPMRWVMQSLTCIFCIYWVFGLFDYNFADTELLIFHALHWSLITGISVRGPNGSSSEPDQEA